MAGYELIKDLSILEAQRFPVLTPQPFQVLGELDYPATPSTVNDGIDVERAVWALVGGINQGVSGKWTTWLQVTSGDAGQDYGLDFFDGSYQITYTGSADIPTIIAGLLAAAPLQASFVAQGGTAVQVAGHDDIIAFTWDAIPPFIPNTNADREQVSTATLANSTYQRAVSEAGRTTYRVMGLPLNSVVWGNIDDIVRVVHSADMSRIKVAGYDRVAVVPVEGDGAFLPLVAPCLLEEGDFQKANSSQLQISADQIAAAYEALWGNMSLTTGRLEPLDRLPVSRSPVSVHFATTPTESVTISEIVIPANATRKGFILYADVDIHWCFSPGALVAATTGMSKVAAGVPFTMSGPSIPGDAIAVISAAGAAAVYAVDWS